MAHYTGMKIGARSVLASGVGAGGGGPDGCGRACGCNDGEGRFTSPAALADEEGGTAACGVT